MASSLKTGSTPRHASLSKVVITVQSFVILSLSLWIIEEYMNNQYLRQYVSDVFQADGLIIGMVGTLLLLGSVSSLMWVRKRHGEKRFGAVSLEVTPPRPSIKVAAPTSTKLAEPSTKPAESSARPNLDFHPVVAALKADMADRRLSFGSMIGPGTEQPRAVSPPSVEVPKTSVLDQLTPNRQAPMTSPRPGQIRTSLPERPMIGPSSQESSSPRLEQPATSLAPRPLPFLKSQEPAGSSVLQSSQQPAPQMPTNVTTVITGIMPAQKKKDPAAASEEKSSSSQ